MKLLCRLFGHNYYRPQGILTGSDLNHKYDFCWRCGYRPEGSHDHETSARP